MAGLQRKGLEGEGQANGREQKGQGKAGLSGQGLLIIYPMEGPG